MLKTALLTIETLYPTIVLIQFEMHFQCKISKVNLKSCSYMGNNKWTLLSYCFNVCVI